MRESKGSRDWESWIDQQIREARQRGEFEKLPGMGQPLDLTPNPYAKGRELAFKILQDAGFAPDWIELDKAIRDKLEKTRAALRQSWTWREARRAELVDHADKWASEEQQRVLASWQRAVASFEEDVASINQEIAALNLKVPSPRFQRSKEDAAREIMDLEGEWHETRG